MRRRTLLRLKGTKMDFCAAIEQAIEQAPTSEQAEKLRAMLADCRKSDGGVTTQSGPTSPPPKKPPTPIG